jgi:collagen type III alpha
MASGNITSGNSAHEAPASGVNSAADQEVERFIELQLRATRNRVKFVDLANVGMLVLVGSLAYLFVLALAEHWLVAGGFSSRWRFIAFGLLASVWLYYALRHGFPTLFGRINPLYAAQQIEQSRPTLKNSLINFLQLRYRSNHVAPAIYQAIEHRAANDLSTIEIDHAIDRSRLVKLATALAVIVFCGAIYKVFSPKDPIRSMARVVAPWADWSAPTRVNIAEIMPGNSQEFIGQRTKVSCRVTGLWSGEAPTLTYSTADGQEVDRKLSLIKADEANRYYVELPDTSGGLQQDLIYSLSAGDAQTRPFTLKVVTVPAIIVDRVKYKYPAYTQMPERVVERQGDLRAIEGTVVTIEAAANDTIQSANLDYERDGAALVHMTAKDRRATVDISLRLKPNSSESEHRDYQLLFKTPAGSGNPSPIGYKIETIPDAPPLVSLVEPRPKENDTLELPLGRSMQLAVSAQDVDFRLGSVTIKLDKNGTKFFEQSLLTYDSKQPEDKRPTRFEGGWLFDTAKFVRRLRSTDELKAGDVVGVTVEATDNKQPAPNVAKTDRLLVRIVAPSSADPPQNDQLAKNDPTKNQPPMNDQGKKPNEQQQEPGSKQDQAKNGDDKQNVDKKSGDSKNGEQKAGGEKSGENKPGDDQKPGDNKSTGDKPGNDANKNDGGKPGENKPGDMPPGENKQPGQGEPQKNDAGKDDKQQGNQGQAKAGEQGKQGGEPQKPGENQAGGDKQGEKNQGQQADPKGNLGQEQPGDSKPSDDPKAGEKQQAGNGNKQQQGGKQGQQTEQGKVDGEGKRIDPQGNPGEAIEKINQHFGDDKQLARLDPKPQGKPDQNKAGGNEQKQNGDAKGGEQKQAGNEKGADQKAGEQKPGDQKQGEQKPGDQKAGQEKQAGNQSKGGEPKQGDKSAGNNGGEKKAGDQNQGQQPGDKSGDMPQPKNGEQPQGQKPAGEQPSEKQNGNQSGEQQPGKPQQGDGGNNKDEQGKKPGEQQPGKSGQAGDMASDSNSSGTPGAGQSGDKPQSTTSPQAANKGKDKESPESQGDSNKGNDPSSPSRSEKDSNSQGDSSGDQSGGGKKGGGQKSNQAGTGAAGTNTAAEQGGSQTAGKGDGPASNKGGDQAKADQPSGGKSSGEKGAGSQSQPGGDKPGGQEQGKNGNQGDGKSSGEAGAPSSDKSGKPQGKESQQQGPPGSNSGSGMGAPSGDGKPGERVIPADSLNGPEPGGEDPNLEYARKATELAVQRLKDQLAKGEPDPELLKRLAWTKDDARKFVEQWESMMRSAQTPTNDGNTARRELDERLRSLGLRPTGTKLTGDRTKSDQQRGLREGTRSSPPAEYADQFRAFTTGTGKKTN